MSPQPQVGLTTREQNLLSIIQELYPLDRRRAEREWLAFRGVGRAMLVKLEGLELVAPTPPELSTRARNVLEGAGIALTKPAVREAFENWSLWAARNCGQKTLRELYGWAFELNTEQKI